MFAKDRGVEIVPYQNAAQAVLAKLKREIWESLLMSLLLEIFIVIGDLSQMASLFAATGHVNYAKCGEEMNKLPETNCWVIVFSIYQR